MGSRLIPLLVKRGHEVKALVREGSEKKLPVGASGVIGDALQPRSYTEELRGADTFVHLIGTPHPNPAKAKQFHDVDLVSAQVAVNAARDRGVDPAAARASHSPELLRSMLRSCDRGRPRARPGTPYAAAVRPAAPIRRVLRQPLSPDPPLGRQRASEDHRQR